MRLKNSAMLVALIATSSGCSSISETELQSSAAKAAINQPSFCALYRECRARFLEDAEGQAARHPGARVWSEPLSEAGDDNLWVDMAYFPAAHDQDSKLAIFSSGIHGLEGYTGSTVQRLVMAEMLETLTGRGVSVLMLHGINAYGMQHRLRHTANRVDLNRNWFLPDTMPAGIDDRDYDDFRSIFAPTGRARFGNLDFSRFLATSILPNLGSVRSGRLTKAAGQGQYRDATGISYGGRGYEPHRDLVTGILDRYLTGRKDVLVMDLHTGLGKRQLQLLPNPPFDAAVGQRRRAVFEVLGRKIEDTGGTAFYSSHGDFSDFVCLYAFKRHQVAGCANMLVEYGTLMPPDWVERGPVQMTIDTLASAYTLYMAVRENQDAQYGAESAATHAEIRTAWIEMFHPADTGWRGMVLAETRLLFPEFFARFTN